MKQTIRLTETELKGIISESVNNILSELDWRTSKNAAYKAFEKATDPTSTEWERQRRQNQVDSFNDYAHKRLKTQYGIDSIEDRKAEHEREKSLGKNVGDFKYTNGELKKLDARERDKKNFFNDKQEYRDGRWQNKTTDEAINRIVKEAVNKILTESSIDDVFDGMPHTYTVDLYTRSEGKFGYAFSNIRNYDELNAAIKEKFPDVLNWKNPRRNKPFNGRH